MAILSYSQQQTIKPISPNNASLFTQLETEVEEKEILQLLGVKFLQAVQADPSSFTDLLDETEFEDSAGDTIKHKGLRYVIAYMVYSKYVGEGYMKDTFTGMVKKSREESTQLSEGEIRRLQNESRTLALLAWDTIEQYLNLNATDYEFWYNNAPQIYRPKIFGVNKTKYNA